MTAPPAMLVACLFPLLGAAVRQATPRMVPEAALPFILAALVLFGLYMLHGIWAWCAGNRAQLTPGQFRRRLTGGILLETDLLLWFMADPWMAGRPARERLLYLLLLTLIITVVMLLAVREAAFVARQYARWRGELIRGMARRDSGDTRKP